MEAIVATVIGVILGYALSAGERWWRERSETQERIKAVRLLLRLEVGQNLDLVRLLSTGIERDSHDESDPEFAAINSARTLIHSPLPPWSHDIFKSQLAGIPVALTPHEIQELYQHHNRLDGIEVIRSTLKQLHEEQQAEFRAPKTGTVVTIAMPASVFQRNAGTLWAECKRLMDALESAGNPV